uniref:Uncharacterized protein n=1 Tax=Canis lupus familiaris TaxID=9615 RepID=A0A8P0PFY6_CANLF
MESHVGLPEGKKGASDLIFPETTLEVPHPLAKRAPGLGCGAPATAALCSSQVALEPNPFKAGDAVIVSLLFFFFFFF